MTVAFCATALTVHCADLPVVAWVIWYKPWPVAPEPRSVNKADMPPVSMIDPWTALKTAPATTRDWLRDGGRVGPTEANMVGVLFKN